MKTDPPHILCVNPWIHDFAAFDFWAKPLGLLSLAAMLRQGGARVTYVDCLDRFHPNGKQPVKVGWDGRGPYRKTPIDFQESMARFQDNPGAMPDPGRNFYRYGIDPPWLTQELKSLGRPPLNPERKGPPDLILVTSIMTYWASGVAETIQAIKSVFPDVPVVLGGIYASLCPDHATAHSGADRVIQGHGEPVLGGIVREYTGFDLALPKGLHDLDNLPFPALDLSRRLTYAPILTSRGCPFSCEYCASSFLEPGLRRRTTDHVFEEIIHWHKTQGIKNFAFYDDALLVNSRNYAFPLMEKIIDAGLDLWFHTPNALHIRGINAQAAQLMFQSGFKTIRLGLETTDFSNHRNHDIKVRADEFFLAIHALKKAGFKEAQIGAYLLCGLPGQKIQDVHMSMDLVKEAGITPVLAYYTPIPHTPMWEEAVRNSRFDIEQHPVFTNNTLFPCVASDKERAHISQLKNL